MPRSLKLETRISRSASGYCCSSRSAWRSFSCPFNANAASRHGWCARKPAITACQLPPQALGVGARRRQRALELRALLCLGVGRALLARELESGGKLDDERRGAGGGPKASRQITDEVASWPGVTTADGNWGAFQFMLGERELGHLHGDRAAHFVFPKEVWADLMEQGRIVPHPVFPDREGPAARRIEDEADVADVIALMRLNYDRAVARNGVPAESQA